jgi:hypothetical protein
MMEKRLFSLPGWISTLITRLPKEVSMPTAGFIGIDYKREEVKVVPYIDNLKFGQDSHSNNEPVVIGYFDAREYDKVIFFVNEIVDKDGIVSVIYQHDEKFVRLRFPALLYFRVEDFYIQDFLERFGEPASAIEKGIRSVKAEMLASKTINVGSADFFKNFRKGAEVPVYVAATEEPNKGILVGNAEIKTVKSIYS